MISYRENSNSNRAYDEGSGGTNFKEVRLLDIPNRLSRERGWGITGTHSTTGASLKRFAHDRGRDQGHGRESEK